MQHKDESPGGGENGCLVDHPYSSYQSPDTTCRLKSSRSCAAAPLHCTLLAPSLQHAFVLRPSRAAHEWSPCLDTAAYDICMFNLATDL